MIYEKIKYPDGQISVKISQFADPIVVERINSYEDLFFVKSIADAYNHYWREEGCYDMASQLILFIPCLFGQRSDRRFASNQSFDLKIIAEIINSCNFLKVKILDPHSDVSLALINNSYKHSPLEFICRCIDPDYKNFGYPNILNEECKKDVVIISPDAGAYKKCFSYGELLGLPVISANKYRDLSGNISLIFTGDVANKKCLIVDDLAEGGATFIALGKYLKEQKAQSVNLYVSHGFFSKGFDELKKYIDHIYCTNSVRDIEDDYVTQFKII